MMTRRTGLRLAGKTALLCAALATVHPAVCADGLTSIDVEAPGAKTLSLEALRGRVDAGDDLAMLERVRRLWAEGTAEADTEALTLARRAARRGSTDAIDAIALAHETGRGTPKNMARAMELFQEAGRAGSAFAHFHLSRLYGEGLLGRDAERQFRHMQIAAMHDVAPAARQLARHFHRGYGCAPDPDAARSWFMRADRLGDAQSAYELGLGYLRKKFGLPFDPSQAVTCFERAARRGHLDAKGELAYAYLNGSGTKRDLVAARELAETVSAAGGGGGDLVLGLIYLKGHGVKIDASRAQEHLARAGSRGVMLAYFHLGLALEKGDVLPLNVNGAIQAYREGMRGLDYRCAFALAGCYADSKIDPPDFVEAHALYQFSIEKLGEDYDGGSMAAYRKSIADGLTPAERKRADQRTDELRRASEPSDVGSRR